MRRIYFSMLLAAVAVLVVPALVAAEEESPINPCISCRAS